MKCIYVFILKEEGNSLRRVPFCLPLLSLLLFFFNFTYLFIFGCTGSLLLLTGFSLAMVSRDYSLSRCASFSTWKLP